MNDTKHTDFDKYALQSSLFKGRSNLYYCYLKSEKVAAALAKISADMNLTESDVLNELLRLSAGIPDTITAVARGAVPESAVIAQLFRARTLITLVASEGRIGKENAALLTEAYEIVVRRMQGAAVVPLVLYNELEVSELSQSPLPSQTKGQTDKRQITAIPKGHSERRDAILKVVTDSGKVSIKDISKVIRDCSEKTIQRELSELMHSGLVRKEGERRWSMYVPATGNS